MKLIIIIYVLEIHNPLIKGDTTLKHEHHANRRTRPDNQHTERIREKTGRTHKKNGTTRLLT